MKEEEFKKIYRKLTETQTSPVPIETVVQELILKGYEEADILELFCKFYTGEDYRYTVQFTRLPNWSSSARPYYIVEKNFTHITFNDQ